MNARWMGGLVRRIFCGFGWCGCLVGWGLGRLRRVLLLRSVPSTASAVSQGGAGKTMLLWPDGAPGALGTEDVDKPTLTVFLPVEENATKTGVVVAPGGGYTHLAMEKEGFAICAVVE